MAADFSNNKLKVIYETVVPMKIHPLCHGIPFILHYLPYPFSIPLKGEKFMKEHVDKVTPSAYNYCVRHTKTTYILHMWRN